MRIGYFAAAVRTKVVCISGKSSILASLTLSRGVHPVPLEVLAPFESEGEQKRIVVARGVENRVRLNLQAAALDLKDSEQPRE